MLSFVEPGKMDVVIVAAEANIVELEVDITAAIIDPINKDNGIGPNNFLAK